MLERNNLIHQDLAGFDPNSEESCRKWITRLDKQNERIVTLHKELQQLLDVHNEAAEQMQVAVESERDLAEASNPSAGTQMLRWSLGYFVS